MEFFATINTSATAAQLKQLITIARLTDLCASITQVMQDLGGHGEIYCLWGQFIIHREELRDGVRFTLPDCPNAAQWTITTHPEALQGQSLIHLTINRQSADPDFIESIELFVEDWQRGIEQHAI